VLTPAAAFPNLKRADSVYAGWPSFGRRTRQRASKRHRARLQIGNARLESAHAGLGKKKATVSICVFCGNYRGAWKKHGRYAWVYAFWGIKPRSTRWVADTYRQRFGIETSYRQLNEARIKTCTRNPGYDFFSSPWH